MVKNEDLGASGSSVGLTVRPRIEFHDFPGASVLYVLTCKLGIIIIVST